MRLSGTLSIEVTCVHGWSFLFTFFIGAAAANLEVCVFLCVEVRTTIPLRHPRAR